jgi:hypothetical protein
LLIHYYLENHISLQHFDRTIFEGVIALFDVEYFIKMGAGVGDLFYFQIQHHIISIGISGGKRRMSFSKYLFLSVCLEMDNILFCRYLCLMNRRMTDIGVEERRTMWQPNGHAMHDE